MTIPQEPQNEFGTQNPYRSDMRPQPEPPEARPWNGHLGTHRPQRIETKPSFRTTEFYVYIAAVIAVLIASKVVGSSEHHGDLFPAERAWFFVVLLTIGYLGSRGLAKAGANAPAESERIGSQDPALRAANYR